MNIMYGELAEWWYLISPAESYAEEAEFFIEQLSSVSRRPEASLLELGSGGGNNALHMKAAFQQVTLSDLSPQMLAMSRQINPECEHVAGDMRTLRLDRQFDAVFVHDALDYMNTEADLRQCLQTVYVHCKAGGMALLVPDHVQENFEPMTGLEGADDEGRAVRFIEWSYDPDPLDHEYITDYVFVLREGAQAPRIIHEQHRLGLFALNDWIRLLGEVGFDVQVVTDPYERYVFVAHKP